MTSLGAVREQSTLLKRGDDSKGMVANVKEANNYKFLQKDDKMVPFGLTNATETFQKMVLGFHNSDAQLQSRSQDGNQDEVFFDAMDEF